MVSKDELGSSNKISFLNINLIFFIYFIYSMTRIGGYML
ncbi:hypothetical protein Godav_023104, partial [Gossypium davidsonii]|nr:hypothetical protein [Gossypium davidsonii]